MKGGDAVILRLAATIPEPNRDVTYILYECEEIDSQFNGLYLLGQTHPELMEADFAILMEPSNAEVEAGCQGTLRVEVRATGERAHSARSWKGVNAIHRATPILERLNGVRAAQAAHRRAGVPRGAQRRRHPRRRRRQRAARRVRGRGQLPLRPGPQRGRGAGVRPRASSTATTSRSPTAPRERCPGWTCRPPRRSSRRSVARSTPSSAGPTWPASRASASRRSTSAPATRCSPTSRRSTCPWSTSSAASGSCGSG